MNKDIPIPLDGSQLMDILAKFDERTQEDFIKYVELRNIIYENKEKKPSKNLKKKTEEWENVKVSLDYKQIFGTTGIFKKLRLVEYNFDFFKFERIDSLGTIEIKDANDDPKYIYTGRPILKSVPRAIADMGR
ncbi:MAG: hypothetical protein WCE94_10410 [Candidatus Methanoperedens sp.]